MEYSPPPQNYSSYYLNSGWEYHEEMINYEQSSQLGYAPGLQNDQSNSMGNIPPPQNDPRYYTHGGWEYREHEMGCFPGPQNGPYFDECNHYSCCGWEDQNQRDFTHSYPIHQEPSPLNYLTSHPRFTYPNSSSLEHASTQNSFQNPYNSFHHPQNLFHYIQDSFHSPQKSFHHPQSSYHSQNM
ncbi:hypothetical protein AHAS_Ahas13G0316300 [Arachis hypogaea]